jgi:hypothetical protein
MRTEANLRRLAEIGVDAYHPRTSVGTAPSRAHAAVFAAAPAPYAPAASRLVVLLAPAGGGAGEKLLTDVHRALAGAGLEPVRAGAVEDVGRARALIAFGAAQARAAGAAVPADRQREMEWIVAADVADLRGNGTAKRVLWSELKRAMRKLRARS